ncbi:8313_t:CDS:2 [Ambispora gerdemannii]|uniref:8313_t:CDS:1 n=1 Tax=Ambispora gerdemannii TaxID=144530 RepID=A0A9N8V9N8_9GLOM|nr:8313_t:CDS:2 [Ambispora gerdemannii]
MGIRGLNAYIKNQNLGTPVSWARTTSTTTTAPQSISQVKTCTLEKSNAKNYLEEKQRYFVFDGNAFIYHIYTGKLNWVFGGQYTTFANLVNSHTKTTHAYEIDQTYLFDGPLPLLKQKTRVSRFREGIDKCKNLPSSINFSKKGFLIPPLTLEIAIQTLRKISNVKMEMCAGEADNSVASIARSVNGYAIGNDSDYFVHDLRGESDNDEWFGGGRSGGGYIPLDTLQIPKSDGLTNNERISATVYRTIDIASHFNIPVSLLPLLGSLNGNDYIEPKTRKNLHESVKQYSSTTDSTNTNFNSLPPYFYDAFKSGRVSHMLMDVVCNRIFWCAPFLEDQSKESAWILSRPVRKWIYAILDVITVEDDRIKTSEKESSTVLECLRRKNHLIYEEIKIIPHEEIFRFFKEYNSSSLPKFDDLISMPKEIRTKLFFHILNSDIPKVYNLSLLSSSSSLFHQFLAASLRYLVHNLALSSSNKITNQEVYAFISSSIFVSFLDKSIDYDYNYKNDGYINIIHLTSQYQHLIHSAWMLAQSLSLYDFVDGVSLCHLYDGCAFHYFYRKIGNAKVMNNVDSSSIMRPVFEAAVQEFCTASSENEKDGELLLQEFEQVCQIVEEGLVDEISFIKMTDNLKKKKNREISHVQIDTNNPYSVLENYNQ